MVGVGDLVSGDDGWAEGAEGGEGFAEGPLRGGELDVAGGDVVADGVAEDVLLPVGGGDLVAGFGDDEGEFGLVVGLGAEFGEDDGDVGADNGAGELHEDGGDLLDGHVGFGGVLLVVEADGEDAWRARDGGEESDFGERDAGYDSESFPCGCEGVGAGLDEVEHGVVAESGEIGDLGPGGGAEG